MWPLLLAAASPVAQEPPPAPEVLAPVVDVLVHPPRVPDFRWGAETSGLVTAWVERGLADLGGVSPAVYGAPALPGLGRPLVGSEGWTAEVTLGTDPQALRVGITLCDPVGRCLDHQAVGTRDAPFAAVASVLVQVSQQLGRSPAVEARSWAAAPSDDAYAVLILGRAAAQFYGLRPPLDPEAVGDRRRDPIARAVWIDPSMEVAQGLLGRHLTASDPAAALAAFGAAALHAGEANPVVLADHAMAAARAGELRLATDRWSQVQHHLPDDPRFVVPRLQAELARGDIDGVLDELLRLGGRLGPDPAVASLRVAVADAADAHRAADLDVLLADWQRVDVEAIEPVARRLDLRLVAGDYAGALELADVMHDRGARREAMRFKLALGAALGHWGAAEQAALALGEPEAAARLAAAGAADPAAAARALAATSDPRAMLVRGELLLTAGSAVEALALATRVLALDPWGADALVLKVKALTLLGRHGEAHEALTRLRHADPDTAAALAGEG